MNEEALNTSLGQFPESGHQLPARDGKCHPQGD